jgi:hypothetical protein
VRWKQTVTDKKYWNIIWHVHSSHYSGWGLLDYDAMLSYTWMLMFWMNVQPPSSVSTLKIWGKFFQRVDMRPWDYTVWKPTRPWSEEISMI